MKELINKSIGAAILISLGNYALLKLGNPIGPVIFALGLLGVCYMGQNLFTGKCGFLFADKIKFRDLMIILIVNLIAGYLCGLAYSLCDGDIVVNSIAKSPVFIMSERESIEKRFIFQSKDGNAYYIMSSSVPDYLFPEKKDIIRITNFINYYKIVDAGDYIEFYSLNQTDFKMPIPQFLINVTLPTTTKNWQIYLENFANEAKYDKIRKTIIQNNDNNEERENKNT